MTLTGLLLAYWLVGILTLHQRPWLIDRSGGPSEAIRAALKLSLLWPIWIANR